MPCRPTMTTPWEAEARLPAMPRPATPQRSMSMLHHVGHAAPVSADRAPLLRRLSTDQQSTEKPLLREFSVDVEETFQRLLEQEDTDGDMQISISDRGPKSITLKTVKGTTAEVRGTYMLASLLQELALAKDRGERHMVIREAQLAEDPIHRLSRMIRTMFWDNLTRRIDAEGLEKVLLDPKNRSSHRRQLLYVPENEPDMLALSLIHI